MYSTDQCQSYLSHVYKRHDCYMPAAPTYIPNEEDEVNDHDEDGNDMAGDPADHGDPTEQPLRHHAFTLAVAEFAIKCLEQYKLTQRSMDGIIADLTSLWQLALHQIGEVVNDNTAVPFDLKTALPNELLEPFKHISTDYNRRSIFSEAFNLLVNLYPYTIY